MNGLAHEVARKTLNLEDVRRSAVALPPLAEQRRIGTEVERLISIVEEVEQVANTTMQRAQLLRHAVLASAFANPAPSGSLNAIEEARS
jgi:type I restriction enzyme S subunit